MLQLVKIVILWSLSIFTLSKELFEFFCAYYIGFVRIWAQTIFFSKLKKIRKYRVEPLSRQNFHLIFKISTHGTVSINSFYLCNKKHIMGSEVTEYLVLQNWKVWICDLWDLVYFTTTAWNCLLKPGGFITKNGNSSP